jgi:hypothetical protein
MYIARPAVVFAGLGKVAVWPVALKPITIAEALLRLE